MLTVYGKLKPRDAAEPVIDRYEDPMPSGWWLLPAAAAGAGIWAALIWWAPAAAGVLLVACGFVALRGL